MYIVGTCAKPMKATFANRPMGLIPEIIIYSFIYRASDVGLFCIDEIQISNL